MLRSRPWARVMNDDGDNDHGETAPTTVPRCCDDDDDANGVLLQAELAAGREEMAALASACGQQQQQLRSPRVSSDQEEQRRGVGGAGRSCSADPLLFDDAPPAPAASELSPASSAASSLIWLVCSSGSAHVKGMGPIEPCERRTQVFRTCKHHTKQPLIGKQETWRRPIGHDNPTCTHACMHQPSGTYLHNMPLLRHLYGLTQPLLFSQSRSEEGPCCSIWLYRHSFRTKGEHQANSSIAPQIHWNRA